METWQDTKDLFFETVGDTEGTNAYFSQTQVVAWANKALWEIAQACRPLDEVKTFSTVSGTALYGLSTTTQGVLGLSRVEIADKPICAVTRIDLSRGVRNWREQSGEPKRYYLDAPVADPDTYTVGLYPEPGAVYSARCYMQVVPTAVSDDADSDYIQLPKWAAPAVLYSMISDAYMSRGKAVDMEVAGFYRMLFEDTVYRLKARNLSRLNKCRTVGSRSSARVRSVRDLLPDTIPEPS